jgi:competence protein ComEC
LDIPFYQTPDTGAQIWFFGGLKDAPAIPIFWRNAMKRIWHRNAAIGQNIY